MGTYRSALGKQVDMAALISKNQKVRAVGNMSVNARGDTIDSFGRVIQPVTEKVTTNYSKTVGNRSAQASKAAPQRSKIQEDVASQEQEVLPEPMDLTDYEKELTMDLDIEDKEIEEIKAKEAKK